MIIMKQYQCTILNMTCGGCVKRITLAIQKLDSKAVINADVETNRVKIETSIADFSQIAAQLEQIGYSTTNVS